MFSGETLLAYLLVVSNLYKYLMYTYKPKRSCGSSLAPALMNHDEISTTHLVPSKANVKMVRLSQARIQSSLTSNKVLISGPEY